MAPLDSPIRAGHLAAIRQLRAWRPDAQVAMIGATALALQLRDYWRNTADVDLVVAVAVEALGELASLAGWRRHPQLEHKWFVAGGASLDIVPAAPELVAAGEIIWPASGDRMNLAGLRLALHVRNEILLGQGLTLQVAPLHVVTVLKMVAYLDRPLERERDLEDLGHLLESCVDAGDARLYSDEVFDAGLSIESAPAFLLGRDVGGVVNEAERDVIARFVSTVRDEREPHATQARMTRVGPRAWRKDPAALLARGLGLAP